MFRKKLVTLVLIAASALTALAVSVPGAFAASSGPTLAGAPANDPAYFDNRSDAVSLLVSYINALDRSEFDRAYSYWETGSAVGTYSAFKAGYATTQSITISTGQVGGSAGAGQRYYVVPVTLNATTTSGPATYVGCYVEHLALPELQSVPPFHGLAIASATILQVTGGANADTLRAQACTTAGYDGLPLVTITQTPGAPESGAQFYIDSRSGPLEVIQSLVNALNRKEYARAYGYWEPSASLPTFAAFAQGYANTQAVQWTYGPVSSDAGAGQFYYSVPATLRAQTAGGLQTFVGCYVLHLANPGIQDNPPYQPIGIRSGSFTQVANTADTNSLMATACQNPPAQNPPPVSNGLTYISFAPGATSATVDGSVAAGGIQEYRLWIGAGQWLIADLNAAQPNAYLQIFVGATGQLIGQTTPGTVHWQGLTPSTGRYWVRVISNGQAASYNLKLTIPRRVSFARGAVSATIFGNVSAGGINSYVLRALGGQTMTVNLNVLTTGVRLEIYRLSDGQSLLSGGANATSWTGVLPSSDDYILRVVSTSLHTTYSLGVIIR